MAALKYYMGKAQEKHWHPTSVKRDGKDFPVELPPIWQRRYDPDTTDETESRYIDSLLECEDFDYRPDVYHGYELILINECHTLSLYMIIAQDAPAVGFIPDGIESKPGKRGAPMIANVYKGDRIFEAVYALEDTAEELAQQIRRIKLSAESQKKPGNTAADAHIFEQRGRKNHRLDGEPYNMPTWRCHFEGCSFDMPDTVGTVLLIHLVKNRGKEFRADELVRAVRGTTFQTDTTCAMSDDEASANQLSISAQATGGLLAISKADLAKLKDERRDIIRQIDEIGDDPGLQIDRANLEQKLEEIDEYAKPLTRTGAHGAQPKIDKGDITRAANLIGKHLRSVLKALKKLDAGCHEHFADKLVLTFGERCEYSHNKGHIWDIRHL